MNPPNPDPLYGGYQRTGMQNQQQISSMQNMMMMQNMGQMSSMSSMPNMMPMNTMGLNSLNPSALQMQQLGNIQSPISANNLLNQSMMMNAQQQYNYPNATQGRMINQIPNNSMLSMPPSINNPLNNLPQFPNQPPMGFNQPMAFQPQQSQPLPNQLPNNHQKKRHPKSTNQKRHSVPQQPSSPSIYPSTTAQAPSTPQQASNIYSPKLSTTQVPQPTNLLSSQTHSPKTPNFGQIQSTPVMPEQMNSRIATTSTTPQIQGPTSNSFQSVPDVPISSNNTTSESFYAQQHILQHVNQTIPTEFNIKVQIDHVNQLTDEKQDLFYTLFECNKLSKQKEERKDKFLTLFLKHIYSISKNSLQIIAYLIDQFRQNSDKYHYFKEPPLPSLFYRKKRAKPFYKMLALLHSTKDTFQLTIPQKVRKDTNVLVLGQFYCVTETVSPKSIIVDNRELQPSYFGQTQPYFLISSNIQNSNPISITIHTEESFPLLTFFIVQFVSRTEDFELVKSIANQAGSTEMIEGLQPDQVRCIKVRTDKCGSNCSFDFTQTMDQLAQSGNVNCPTCGQSILLNNLVFLHISYTSEANQQQNVQSNQQQVVAQNNTQIVAPSIQPTKSQVTQAPTKTQSTKKKQHPQSTPPQQQQEKIPKTKQNKRVQNSSSQMNTVVQPPQPISTEPVIQQPKPVEEMVKKEPSQFVGRIATKKLFPPTPAKKIVIEETEEMIKIRNHLQENLTYFLKPQSKVKFSVATFNSKGITERSDDDFDVENMDSYIDFFNQFD